MALTKVSTPAIKDEAITLAKLLHGDANSDGKFLRANNGADPTFETITGTTINNNADNRLITGSGTANTLEAESGLTYSSNELTVTEQITVDSPNNVTSIGGDYALKLQGGDASNDIVNLRFSTDADGGLAQVSAIAEITGSYPNSAGSLLLCVQSGGAIYEALRINSARNIGIGTQSPNTKLHILGSNNNAEFEALRLHNNNTGGQTKTSIGFTNTTQADYEHAKITATRDNSGRLDFFVGAQSHAVLCVDGYASGVVGVNTVQASFPLDVNGKMRGHGILFGSDTASANTLDDYETGTWTPSNPTVGMYSDSSLSGHYQKIGNFVHFQLQCRFNSNSSGVGAVIDGFPFNSAESGNNYDYGACVMYSTRTIGGALIANGGSRIHLYDTSGNNLNCADMSNHYVRLNGFVEVS